ncbi:WhiB family transcriptional regulator [Streptacidiphilus rugosus]|uniref:WhiB family transcriptional regulator n=1 Tax=Streptacidiphilus rugosus TaxID=405783 RepID=UPI00056AC1EB|nr:WhiB family transcriptional regulator [Streptacidiphilus rugosus]
MKPTGPDNPLRGQPTPDWHAHANCIGADPELFFPISSTGLGRLQAQAAKSICRSCTVADDCARWALRHGETYGIWGGLDEEERRAARRSSLGPTSDSA